MHLTRADCLRLGIDLSAYLPPTGEPKRAGLAQAIAAAQKRALLPDGPPGRWVCSVPGFRPALANELLTRHWGRAHRLKVRDARAVHAACLIAGVTRPKGKRRVECVITGPFRRLPDPDAAIKALLDACVTAGALHDDGAQWALWRPVEFARGELGTVIEIEDIEG